MLLELRGLSQSLQDAGVGTSCTDNHLVPYPNRPTWEARIDGSGQIKGLRLLAAEQVQLMRKYECSTGGLREATPGFNITPLWTVRRGGNPIDFAKKLDTLLKASRKGRLSTIEERQAQLDDLLTQAEAGWGSRVRAVEQSLNGAAQVLQTRLGQDQSLQLAPLKELLRRSALLTADELRRQLSGLAREQFLRAEPDTSLERLLQLLFAKPAPPTKPAKPLSLVLELYDADQFAYPANHQTIWRAVNARLLASTPPPAAAEDTASRQIDCFGQFMSGMSSKMPERTLPRLGKVKLRSMAKSASCQSRYGLVEAEACPLGLELQAEFAAALEWVTRPERRDLTWADVSDSCGYDMPAVLIAFPTRLPSDPPQLSGFLSRGGATGERQERKFETFAHTVVERLQGLASSDPRTTISILVLAKADPARTKLLYSRQFAVARLIEAAEEWQQQARNIPPVFIRQFRQDGPPRWQRPLVPFPAEVVRCVNTAWRRIGTEAEQVPSMNIGSGLNLLLESGPILHACAATALHHLLANVTPLLLALGHAHNRNLIHSVPRAHADTPRLLPCILGLLLAKSGSSKGAFMSSNPYWLGRLFSLADKLHWNYCRLERDGETPPQLLGNSMMPTALENPVAGLARLAERLPLYLRKVPLWLRQEVAEVEQKIDKENLPNRCTDADKAQMLLGYLARPDVEKSEDNTEPQTGENR